MEYSTVNSIHTNKTLAGKLICKVLATAISLVLASATVQAQTLATPANAINASNRALAEIVVPADLNGAAYIARRGSDLYIWELNEIASTITLKHIETLNPSLAQTLTIELGASVTGVLGAGSISPALLDAIEAGGPLSLSHGAQTLGPLETLSPADQAAFVSGCRAVLAG